MVIITWMQRGPKGAPAYGMRAVIKPITERDAAPFIVERAHTDATGGTGWVPANHTHAPAIICKALLQLAGGTFDEYVGSRRGLGAAAKAATPLTLDLGMLDLPETSV